MTISNYASYENNVGRIAMEIATWAYETPAEALAFACAAVASRIIGLPFSAPLFGIGTGLFATKLALKALERYNYATLVDISKRIYKINREYPRLQLITFIFTLAIGATLHTIGFILGTALGSYGAVILNIENYKLMQNANRRKQY